VTTTSHRQTLPQRLLNKQNHVLYKWHEESLTNDIRIKLPFWDYDNTKSLLNDISRTCIAWEWHADCSGCRILNVEMIMLENTHRCSVHEPSIMWHKHVLKPSCHLTCKYMQYTVSPNSHLSRRKCTRIKTETDGVHGSRVILLVSVTCSLDITRSTNNYIMKLKSRSDRHWVFPTVKTCCSKSLNPVGCKGCVARMLVISSVIGVYCYIISSFMLLIIVFSSNTLRWRAAKAAGNRPRHSNQWALFLQWYLE